MLISLAVSAMLPVAKQCAFEEPCVETITGENVLTWPHVVSLLALLLFPSGFPNRFLKSERPTSSFIIPFMSSLPKISQSP